MAADDFLTNVETAWLAVIQTNEILSAYNWERWDSDVEMKLPRGRISLRARTDPDETPYRRVETTFTFEGRPKRHKFSIVMKEFQTLLEELETSDLDGASNNTVKFMGKADSVVEDRQVMTGLRVWILSFAIYALPMT